MDPRLVNVPRQRVYGDVPLLLPLIRMSDAEASMLDSEPHIYDKDYPLDYSGLNLDSKWSASPYYAAPVHAGNVAFAPFEKARLNGMGYLGAVKKVAVKAVKTQTKAAAPQPKTSAGTSRLSQLQKQQQQAQSQCQAAGGIFDGTTGMCSGFSTAKAFQASQKQKQQLQKQQDKNSLDCSKASGVFDPSTGMCSGYTTVKAFQSSQKQTNKNQQNTNKLQNQCASAGGIFDGTTGMCSGFSTAKAFQASQKQQTKLQQQCQKTGGTWDSTALTCTPSTNSGTTPQSCQTGYTWDVASGQCLPITPPSTPPIGPNCAQSQVLSCGPGGYQTIGPDGCPTCIVPAVGPNTDPNSYYPPTSPMPPQAPYYPPDYGTGAGMPPQSYGGGGGGGGMPPAGSGFGPGPQMDDSSAGQYAPSVSQSDQTPEATASGDDQDDTTKDPQKDDASSVASDNIFESIAKLFGGGGKGNSMAGLGNPITFATPPMRTQDFIVRPQVQPISSSTTTGVLLAFGVLVAGSAAMFLWTGSKKK